jgi:predicted secreted hydrolase
MFFHLRRRDGRKDAWSSGTLVERDGAARPLGADDVTVEPIDTWTSPHSHTVYPAQFRLAVPAARLDLRVIPLLADQELDLTFRYWEGAVRIEGSAGENRLGGVGYLELTGYGDESHQPR